MPAAEVNDRPPRVPSAERGRQVTFPEEQSRLSTLFKYRGNPLLRFTDLRRMYPPVVGFGLLGRRIIVVHDTSVIEEVLVKRHQDFVKDSYTSELSAVLGRGLLTSEGEHHRRQRRLIAPSLSAPEVMRFAEQMYQAAAKFAAATEPGQTIDAGRACMRLTLDILVSTLFGHSFDAYDAVERELSSVMKAFRPWAELLRATTPSWWPLPSRLRIAKARRTLHHVVDELIEKRRAAGQGDDLLSRLIAARDGGEALDDAELRDEVITLLLAGHETTALGVMYTLRLLALNSDCRRRVEAELDSRLGGHARSAERLLALPYTRAVFLEALRLYPPAWVIGRRAVCDVVVANWRFPAGSELLIPLYTLHRNPAWFDNPDSFQPERFLDDGGAPKYPRFAYAPFGGGPRVCVGQHFAMLEAMAILVGLLENHRFDVATDTPLELSPSITLRAATPIPLQVNPRFAAK